MEKSRTGQGILWGLALFVLLAVLAYVTPVRRPLLRVAGESHPALQYRLEAQRRVLDTLQMLASDGPLIPAAQSRLNETRRAFASTQEQLERWEQGQARISLGGFIAWGLDLFPWLLAFGVALPVFGGLIGAQALHRRKNAEPRDAENPPSVPLEPSPPLPQRSPLRFPPSPTAARTVAVPPPRSPAPAPAANVAPAQSTGNEPPRSFTPPAVPASVPRPDLDRIGKPVFKEPFGDDPASLSRHPALEASRKVTPPAPTPPPAAEAAPASEEWGFRHQPRPVEGRPRPKSPPVRSPHAPHSLGDDVPPPAGP